MSLHANSVLGILADSYDDLGVAPDGTEIWVKDANVFKLCTYNSISRVWTHRETGTHDCSYCPHEKDVVVAVCKLDAEVMVLPQEPIGEPR